MIPITTGAGQHTCIRNHRWLKDEVKHGRNDSRDPTAAPHDITGRVPLPRGRIQCSKANRRAGYHW